MFQLRREAGPVRLRSPTTSRRRRLPVCDLLSPAMSSPRLSRYDIMSPLTFISFLSCINHIMDPVSPVICTINCFVSIPFAARATLLFPLMKHMGSLVLFIHTPFCILIFPTPFVPYVCCVH